MGLLIFGAGVLLGMFLGIVLISLLGMAQQAEDVYDRLDLGETMAIPEDIYYLSPSHQDLPTSCNEGRPSRDLGGLRPKGWRINNVGIPQIPYLRGKTLKKPSGALSPGPLAFRPYKRRQRYLPT
jgi:hypothetical protein